MAALLICAAKDLGVNVPAGELPHHERGERTTLPYRKSADGILAQATDADSLNSALDELLDLADSCKSEGDVGEALLVCLGVAESLLSGVDYRTYSAHFHATEVRGMFAKPPAPTPRGMDAARIDKFNAIWEKSILLRSYAKIQHEQKIPCLKAMHRLYMETVPWGPSHYFSLLLYMVSSTNKDYEFVISMHDPVVPDQTPDPRKDRVGFAAVMDMAEIQLYLYGKIKDHSVRTSYAMRYREDPGICARYIRHLRFRAPQDAPAVVEEGRRLFPDFDAWL